MKKNQQDYLLAVWEITETYGFSNGKEVSKRLKISPPTAWEELHRLAEQGLLEVSKKGVRFTPSGLEETKRIIRNHRISEAFVYTMLEVPWEDTHEEVMEFEHSLKGDLMDKLWKNLGSPERCPHGNPIEPGQRMDEIPLQNIDSGVYRIKRYTYEDHDFLKRLASESMFPGVKIKVHRYGKLWELESQNGLFKVTEEFSKSIRLI